MDLQVRQIDRGICFLSIVVSQEAYVWECPAIDIVHDHDGHVFIGAGNIGIVVRQLSLFAYRCAIPLEAGEAALRHVTECTGMFACFSSDPEGLSGWLMIIMYASRAGDLDLDAREVINNGASISRRVPTPGIACISMTSK